MMTNVLTWVDVQRQLNLKSSGGLKKPPGVTRFECLPDLLEIHHGGDDERTFLVADKWLSEVLGSRFDVTSRKISLDLSDSQMSVVHIGSSNFAQRDWKPL